MIGGAVSHYEVLERLGGGGMGVVYKAWDPRLERFAALKFLSDSRGGADDRHRFLREARAASVLDHPNICTVYDIGETDDGRLFIAMAFCEGESLKAKLDRGPLQLPQALDWSAQVAAGLAEAHAKKIVHRDIKPGNIMITTDGRVKVVDFGIAWLAGETRLTQVGSVVGTPAYVAPEQFRREGLGPRADLWSLGVVLYEMISGALPFSEVSEGGLIRAILKQTQRPVGELRRGVPPDLERLVSRALAKRPADRYPSAIALRADLIACAEALPPTTADDEETRRESPGARRRGSGTPHSASGGGEVRRQPSLVGRTVGHYRIVEHLGGGGMGIVFRAEDLKLARTVALKFLPFELTRDPDSKARFLQEARTASAIDHPNICTIHEIGESDEGQLFLAMACYDGETLKRRLARGPLPSDEAVEIARQVARGLGKAHRAGIVHRDIKPANLMITSDAVVKILDFGIAKLAGSLVLTKAGSSVGSPGYMSPEQARGDDVDPRSDLWALGVVLYEMLSGRRPFRGADDQAVLYALYNESPEPLSRLQPTVAPELERVVNRLLDKSPGGRYDSAAEVLAELRMLAGPTSSPLEPTTLSLRLPQLPAERRPGRRLLAIGLAAAAVAALLAGVFLWRRTDSSTQGPVSASYTRLTSLDGDEEYPTLAPDGQRFAYAKATSGASHLYLQAIGSEQATRLPLEEAATQPAFSPDGRYLAYRSEGDSAGISIFSLANHAVRHLTDFGFNPAWSPDGRELVCATEEARSPQARAAASQLYRIDVATGDRKLIGTTEDAVQPSWSPHGRRLAFWGIPAGTAERVIWTMSADGGPPKRATTDHAVNWDPVWAPDGHYLYYVSDRAGSMNLWRVPIDETSGEVRGAPEAIPTPAPWAGFLTVAANGRRLAYATHEERATLEAIAVDPQSLATTGSPRRVTGGVRAVRSSAASPDGKWIVFDTSAPNEHLFVIHPDGSELRQLTSGPAKDRLPSWSADSSRVLFYSSRSGKFEAWSVGLGNDAPVQLTRTRWASVTVPRWSPDGQWLSCDLVSRGGALIDLRKPLDERRPEALPTASLGGVVFAPLEWSPDGRQLVGIYERRDGANLPGVVIYDVGRRRYERLTEIGTSPSWTHDGRRILFSDGGRIYAVDRRDRSTRLIARPTGESLLTAATASPDGRTVYLMRQEQEGDVWMVDVQ